MEESACPHESRHEPSFLHGRWSLPRRWRGTEQHLHVIHPRLWPAVLATSLLVQTPTPKSMGVILAINHVRLDAHPPIQLLRSTALPHSKTSSHLMMLDSRRARSSRMWNIRHASKWIALAAPRIFASPCVQQSWELNTYWEAVSALPAPKCAPGVWDLHSAKVLTMSVNMEQSRYDGCLFYRFEQLGKHIEEKTRRHVDDFLTKQMTNADCWR